MPMDGDVATSRRNNIISYFLQSGSSRVLNSLRVGEALVAERGEQGSNLLFRTPVLNRSVIFKDLRLVQSGFSGSKSFKVGTKLYVPFNKTKLTEGGQTFFYDPRDFVTIMGNYVDTSDPQRREALSLDMKVLNTLDTLPMFAPFLLRQAFDHAQISIDPAYVAIPESEWQDICAYIRGRFQQILTAVNGDLPIKGDALNRLLDKLWMMNDMPALQGLARAFGLPDDNCTESFYAWKGTLYFCWSFDRLQKAVFELITWLSEWPSLIRVYPPNQRDNAKHKLQALHDDLFHQLRGVEMMLAEYERAFNDLFVNGAGPQRFISFLGNANSQFQDCGMAIGLLQHAHEVWDRLTESFPKRQVNSQVLDEVIDALSGVAAKPLM